MPSGLTKPVGPFSSVGKFANNMLQTMIFNTMVYELLDWAEEVESAKTDPTLPEEVKAQVIVDYGEIQRRFSQISGSMLNG